MASLNRSTTVISAEGAIDLPDAMRVQLGWQSGTRLTAQITPEGVLLRSALLLPATDVDALFGSLRHEGTALSDEEMDAAILREAERRARD